MNFIKTPILATLTLLLFLTSLALSLPIQESGEQCEDESDFRLYGVKLQNEYRKKHGVQPLILDSKLTKEAQDYADVRVIGTDTVAQEEKLRNKYGLITIQIDQRLDPTVAVQRATELWYRSISGYNWDSPLSSSPTANIFAQMVWKSSKLMGIGVASAGNRTVVVVFYDPPGNEQREESFKANVFPPQN